jgi:penicillin-binding protein 1C
VLTPRQPGSTLKPFVYAMAMRNGWNAATMIEDAPYSQSVGQGQHAYRNYSRVHYGAISVRNALGNSLNVPAVKALATVGAAQMLQQLRHLGLRSLERSAEHYGDGLALGNGEVTLLELAGAYAALAHGGVYRPLQLLRDRSTTQPLRVIDAPSSAIIADILADPNARSLEFGSGGVLSLPRQTAVKTGTSNDHRDAWAIGFDHQHVVAVWMGDLQRRPMNRITGASGPALVMRALFAQLNKHTPARALYKPPTLLRLPVCADDGVVVHAKCKRTREEWFSDNNRPRTLKVKAAAAAALRIRQPSAGLRLAIDPRVARADQQYLFALTDIPTHHTVQWFVDGKLIDGCDEQHCLWTLQTGNHTLFAQLQHTPPLDASVPLSRTAPVSFIVH